MASDARARDDAVSGRAAAPFMPDEPAPVRLMNTVWGDRSGVHDELRTVEDLRRWLSVNDRLGSGDQCPDDGDGDLGWSDLGPADLDRFRVLRDALRRLAALLTDDQRPAAVSATTDVRQAVAEINQAVALGATWPQLHFHDGRLQRSSAGTGAGAWAGASAVATRMLSDIAAQAIQLFCGDERVRLRACRAPGCVLYFVKNHPRREWCSTGCGNRVRAARHYQRHRS